MVFLYKAALNGNLRLTFTHLLLIIIIYCRIIRGHGIFLCHNGGTTMAERRHEKASIKIGITGGGIMDTILYYTANAIHYGPF